MENGFSMVWTMKEAQIWHEKYLSNELHKLPSPWCRVLSPSHTPFPHILRLQFLIVQKKKERFLRALSPRADKQYSSQRTARSHTWTVTNMSDTYPNRRLPCTFSLTATPNNPISRIIVMLMNITIAGKFVPTDKQKIRKFLKLAYNNLDG